MKRIFYFPALTVAASLNLVCCNEARRGNDSDFNEDRSQAAASAKDDKLARQKEKDEEFVYETVGSQYGEIKLAELAIQRSHDQEVKRLAEKVQLDQSASLNELKTLAQAKAVSVPVEETDAEKRKLENIADKSGREFDEKWCSEMLEMHRECIDKYQKRRDDTEDPDLKAYMDKTLAVLKSHEKSIEACKDRLKHRNSG